MRVVPSIFANLILILAALGFGGLLGRLFPRGFSLIDRFALRLLGGLGLIGTLLFDVGQVWFSRTVVISLVSLGVFFGFRLLIFASHNPNVRPQKAPVPVIAALTVASVLLVTALGGLVEPMGDLRHDAIAYHFLGPKVWLRDGAIRPVPDQSYTAFPAIVETSYGALMALGGQRAPELFAVTALCSLLLIAAGLAIRLKATPSEAWWVAALIIAMPAVYGGAYLGFIDAVYAAFVLAAVRISFDVKKPSDYLLFGMFCGFAMGTKYTGLIACVLLIGCSLLASVFLQKRDCKMVLKGLAIACVVAAAVASPFYIRNWILLGCPIYPPPPLLPRFFEIKYMSPDAVQRFHQYILKRGEGMGRGPLTLLLLPFNLTYHTANFSGAGGIGLAPLALAPFGVLACRRDAFAKSLSSLAVALTIAWFATEQESRFLIHVYVIGAIFAVLGWKYVVRLAPKFGPALSISVVACSILYGLFMIGRARADDLHSIWSTSFAEKRRHDAIPFYESFDYLNTQPSVTKVLVLDPLIPTYYLDKDYVKPVGSFDEHTLPQAPNLQIILTELHILHISHVLDVRWEATSAIPDHYDVHQVKTAFQLPDHSPDLTLIFERGNERIYRVN